MDIFEVAERVESKEDFINFLQVFQKDFINNYKEWESIDLESYFEAMEAFLFSSTEQSSNKIDFTPSWSLFARIMIAASRYE